MHDHIDIRPVEPYYRLFFENQESRFIEISPNITKMKNIIESIDSNSWGNYQKYSAISSGFLKFGLPTVIEESPDCSYFLRFIWSCLQAFPLLSHSTMLNILFPHSTILRAMLSFQDLYIGLSPYEAPAVFSLLQAIEFENGIYYPIGGFQTLANAFESIAIKNNVKILKNTKVTKLDVSDSTVKQETTVSSLHYQNKLDEGVVQDADLYLLNIDSPHAEWTLLPKNIQDVRTTNGRPSCGVISLHFAFNTTLHPLSHHTLFMSAESATEPNAMRSWEVVSDYNRGTFDPKHFNFYVHATSRTDETTCPMGHDAMSNRC